MPQVTRRQIGWRETLRWFFSFVWAALRNAPEDWFRARKGQLAGVVARSVQGTVFGGSTSAYRVIVDQRGPDGRPAAWYDLREASARVVESMHGRPQRAVADLSELWRDFAAGALTLVDGGSGTSSCRRSGWATSSGCCGRPGTACPTGPATSR